MRVRNLIAPLSMALALAWCGAAFAQEDDDVVMSVVEDEQALEEDFVEEIELPEAASAQAHESAAFGIETANEARDEGDREFGHERAAEAREGGREFGQERAAEARERGQDAREAAADRGSAGNRPEDLPARSD